MTDRKKKFITWSKKTPKRSKDLKDQNDTWILGKFFFKSTYTLYTTYNTLSKISWLLLFISPSYCNSQIAFNCCPKMSIPTCTIFSVHAHNLLIFSELLDMCVDIMGYRKIPWIALLLYILHCTRCMMINLLHVKHAELKKKLKYPFCNNIANS